MGSGSILLGLMNSRTSVVCVVDDEPPVRRALERLIRSAELGVETFASAEEFLDADPPEGPSCLVLDVKMTGLTGLELQDQISGTNRTMPIIFLSGRSDIPTSVTAMKAGAMEFLEKPVDDGDILDAIHRALERDTLDIAQRAADLELQRCTESLTLRERQVFDIVVTGLLNKQIARRLRIAEKTVKVHRARVMQKMKARTFADLVRMAERVEMTKRERPSPDS